MLNRLSIAIVITIGFVGAAMAQERILISSDWGEVSAELVDNDATRSLVRMLPLTIEMRDHLRQEKTGNLPSPLPAVERQLDFSTGTLGLWSSNHLVIYYRNGRVPQPGIIMLGQVTGDVSIFDRPGPVTVRVERIK
ncbi:cyclophilin-like fold protein [Bradyrhizobium sp. sBnM-33]|uniref:cyclophilin-like fold protein n=1 Tax=Bradyrhizobium sp. sBnM-33 TaxID=2831780 RepID=UPI001BCC438E|nr:cyclophilin-like fold protein [Bradyrhizobium sp. sBnM-33]WOH49617.1 cyclophilin-like fold protein [Bradyrhizobium sp. sBnM-33]